MRALPSALLLLLLLPQCGGASSGGSDPKTSADGDDASEQSSSSDGSSEGDDDGASASAEDAPRGPSCDDGTCSPCGAGICPAGWYCDENASGGPACSWLTECADKPSCSCITRVLGSSCTCREEGGGLKVSCG